MPELNCNEAELGTVTRALEPLNDNAPPYLPALAQAAPEIVPTFPFPDESRNRRPTPHQTNTPPPTPTPPPLVAAELVASEVATARDDAERDDRASH